MDTYTEEEWGGAIASLGRLVDVRNFPDTAAKLLMGESPAYRGLGTKAKKHLVPKMIPALVLWTKGPVEIFVEHVDMRQVLEMYDSHKAIIGIQLTVTGFGGTFLEPGIPSPEETAAGLDKVFKTGLVDPDAVLIRYDPLVRIKCPNESILSNATEKSFEKVVSLFGKLGVKNFSTKFLLLSTMKPKKYSHVYERLIDAELIPMRIEDKSGIFKILKKVVDNFDANLKTCCVKVEQNIDDWFYDSGCLSGHRLTLVGKKRFGENWNRITTMKRPSRPGCLCTWYWDLSVNKGFKRCGGFNSIYFHVTCVLRENINSLMKSMSIRRCSAICTCCLPDFLLVGRCISHWPVKCHCLLKHQY